MIEEGAVVDGPFWPERVKINKIEKLGARFHIVGATIKSNKHIDQLLSELDFDKLKRVDSILDFSAPASEVFLSIEALRYKYASLFDPLLGMSTSKIDPLPFQLEAVYCYILKLPQIRFLIADDPGAGKTIMAGLVIKELKLRGLAKRILIVSPGHLKEQWRRELKEKFQENFVLLDRGFMRVYQSESPWEAENQLITSIDFAKQDDVLNSLKSVEWDLVVVDEAHKMAAYKYGKDTHKTARYKVGEVLSRTANNLLFLTATPHKGDSENFRLLLDLLVPGFFANAEMINEARQNRDNPLFIRRMKEDLRNFRGELIFKKRFVKTASFHLSDIELELYNELSRYVVHQYDKALQSDKKRRNTAFALLILQRRMASSIYALLKSLIRRKEKLELIIKDPSLLEEQGIYYANMEDEEERKRWQQELEWETSTASQTIGELHDEVHILNKLIGMAETILDSGKETKLKRFRETMESLGNDRILVFSESKDTVNYLVEKLSLWGYKVNSITGDMNMGERVNAEKVFHDETQVMVATEAAGEGINLQFCNLMINYDIPWNPNRLEQRMGRIHRYKQNRDVFIFNMVADNTTEGRVLIGILNKLDTIREAMGNDKVFDIIGEIFPGNKLYQMITDAVAGIKPVEDIIEEENVNEPVDDKYIQNLIDNVLGGSLASNMDYSAMIDLTEKAKESRMIPEYIEEFFKKAFIKLGGSYYQRKDGTISIKNVPSYIRRLSDDINFKLEFGKVKQSYSRLTFDKQAAFDDQNMEFISFGHPLFEAILKWVKKHYLEELNQGALFRDPSGSFNGIIWFFEGEVSDGRGDIAGKKLFAIHDHKGELKEVNPSLLWDLVPVDNPKPSKIDIDIGNVQEYAINCVEKYQAELSKERERQAQIKRKYGVKSLNYLIGDLDADLIELYDRQNEGDKVDLPILNAETKMKNYEEELKKLQKEIDQEESLIISIPKFVGAVLIEPLSSPMVSNKEIELIGMKVAMEYEKSQGRIPEDVSADNLGFDVRSKSSKETRYIEVKGRVDEGPVALTPNEWFIAKRYQEQYWLYVVTNAPTNPTLYLIQNPNSNLKATEKVEVVRFMVPPSEYKKGKMALNGE